MVSITDEHRNTPNNKRKSVFCCSTDKYKEAPMAISTPTNSTYFSNLIFCSSVLITVSCVYNSNSTYCNAAITIGIGTFKQSELQPMGPTTHSQCYMCLLSFIQFQLMLVNSFDSPTTEPTQPVQNRPCTEAL